MKRAPSSPVAVIAAIALFSALYFSNAEAPDAQKSPIDYMSVLEFDAAFAPDGEEGIQVLDLRGTACYPQPDRLVACGTADTLAILLFTKNETPLGPVDVNLELGEGLQYGGFAMLGSPDGMMMSILDEVSTVNPESPIFRVTNISQATGGVVLHIGIQAGCGVDFVANPPSLTLNLDYNDCQESIELAPLATEPIQPEVVFTGAPGSVDITDVERNFCLSQDITQVTLDAAAGELTVTISNYGFPDIMLDSVAVGGTQVDPAFIDIDMTTGFTTIVLDGNAISDYFGGDGLLDQNEVETIDFCFQISECPPELDLPLNPTLTVLSTCNGDVCGGSMDIEENGEIDISPNFGAIPDADFESIQLPAACDPMTGMPQQYIFDIQMASTVTDPLRGRFDNLRFLIDECDGGALVLDSVQIFEGGTNAGDLVTLPISGAAFDLDENGRIIISFRGLDMDFDAAGGLDDLDGDGFFDDLEGGQSLRIRTYMSPPSCGAPGACAQDSSSETRVCLLTRIITQGIRHCTTNMSISSTINPQDPAINSSSSGYFDNTVNLGSDANPRPGYDFGTFGDRNGGGGTIRRDTGSIQGAFDYTIAADDFNKCPGLGGDVGFQLVYIGDELTSNNIWIDSVMFDGVMVPMGDITKTVSGATAVFDIDAGDPAPGDHTYEFQLRLDTPYCAPTTNYLLTGRVVERCPECECAPFIRACQTVLAQIDPDDYPNCDCNYDAYAQVKRISYGYSDRMRTSALTEDDFPGEDNVELDHWLPGDTVQIEGMWILKDSLPFNGRTERLDFIIQGLQGGSSSMPSVLGRLDVDAARLQSMTIHRGMTIFDVADITPAGSLAGTYDGINLNSVSASAINRHDNAMHPGLGAGTYNHIIRNSSNDYGDGRVLRTYFFGEDRVAPGGFNSLAALYDLVGGTFYNGDTIKHVWHVPVMLTPDVLVNGALTSGPLDEDEIIFRSSMGAYDLIEGSDVLSSNFALSGSVGVCLFQDTAFVHDPGVTLSSEIRYDATGCTAEIEHDFTILNPIPADWYQNPVEYRPVIGMERLFTEWPDPYIYSGGATYELRDDGTGPVVQEPDSINGADLIGDAYCVQDRYGEMVWLDAERVDGVRDVMYDDYDTDNDVLLSGGTYPLLGVGGETMMDPDTLAFVIPLTRLCTSQDPETPVEASHESSYRYLADYRVNTYLCNDGDWYGALNMVDGTGCVPNPAGADADGRYYWPWTREHPNNPHRFAEEVTLTEIGTPVPSVDVDLMVAQDLLMDLGGETNTVTVCPATGESLAGGVMIIEVPNNIMLDMGVPAVTEEMSTDSSVIYSVEIPMGLMVDECFGLELSTTLLFCGPNPICISAVPCPADAELVLLKMLDCVEEVCYGYRAGTPELQAGFEYPVNPSPCVAQDYEVNFNNTGTSFLDSMCVVIYVPNGLMLMPPGSFEVTVTEGGMPITMTIPIAEETDLTGVSGIAYKLDSTALNDLLGEGGLEPGGTIEVNFTGETDCDYISGSAVATMVEAAGDCEPFEFFDRGQPLDVVDPDGGASYSINVEPLEINCTENGSDIRITAINTGKTVSTDATVCLVLPAGLDLEEDDIEVVAPADFMIENYNAEELGDAGAMTITFDAPDQNIGDFLCLDLSLQLDGDQACGPIEFIFDIKTMQSVLCPTLGAPCDIQVSGNPTPFTLEIVPAAKLVNSILVADCGNFLRRSAPLEVLWGIELMSVATEDDVDVDIEFYHDLDGDGMVDDFEPLVAIDNATFAFEEDGEMLTESGVITIDDAEACPLVARLIFEGDCTCNELEVPFPEVVPSAIAELGDNVVLCPGDPLMVDGCDNLMLSLQPAGAGTIEEMPGQGGTEFMVTLNPGFGVLTPVKLIAEYNLGNCSQEFEVCLTQLEEFEFPDIEISACMIGMQQIDLGIPTELQEDITVAIDPPDFLVDPTSQEPILDSPDEDRVYTVTYTIDNGAMECETESMITVSVFEPPSIVELDFMFDCSLEEIVLSDVADIEPDGLDGTWESLGTGTFMNGDTRFSTATRYVPSLEDLDSNEVTLILTTDPIRDTINGVPVVVCGPARDSFTVNVTCIDLSISKQVDTVYESSVEGEFVVKYLVQVANLGDDLDSISVLDDLEMSLGVNYVRLCDAALDGMDPLVLSTPTLMGGNISANPNWGNGGDWEMTEFLEDTLYEGDRFAFCMCIVVDPDGAIGLDTNTVKTHANSIDNLDLSVWDTAGAQFLIPAIEIQKELVACNPAPPSGDAACNSMEGDSVEGLVQADFLLTVINVGNVPLYELSVMDDFADQYGAAFIEVVSGPVVTNIDAIDPPDANPDYDGTGAAPELLQQVGGTDTLESSQRFQITFSVLVDPDAVMPSDTLFNSALAAGMYDLPSSLNPEDGIARDSSDNQPNMDDNPDTPTPGLFPAIGLAKSVDTFSVVKPSGNYAVTMTMVVANLGNDSLSSLSLLDPLTSQLGCAFAGVDSVAIEDMDGDVAAAGGV